METFCAVLDVLERYTMHRKHRLVFSFTYERMIFFPHILKASFVPYFSLVNKFVKSVHIAQ